MANNKMQQLEFTFFDVIERKSVEELVVAINEKIRDGWRPQGGVSSYSVSKGYSESSGIIASEQHYLQAIVKGEVPW